MTTKQQKADNRAPGPGDALLLVDIQNDFLPGGSLAVTGSDRIIPVLNAYIDQFMQRSLPIFASRDWHPQNHSSFIEQGGPWPAHCLAGSIGAKFVRALNLPLSARVISTGTDPEHEGYSGFEHTTLKAQLDQLKVSRLFIGGLATDYCVFNTVCDALKLDYRVLLLTDAVQAVNVHPHDGDSAIREMVQQGAIAVTLEMIQ